MDNEEINKINLKSNEDLKNSFYKDYENLLIKNDQLSQENRELKYNENLLLKQIRTLESKEENQYGPEVQALELTLMNQANVTINKA